MTGKPFPRDRALHAGYRQDVSARRERRELRADLRQLSFIDRLEARPSALAAQPVPELGQPVDLLKLIIDRAALARIVRRNDALAEIDRWAKDPPPAPLVPGDLVVAAAPGGWASRASWRVVACTCDLCALGRHVAVDQPFDEGLRHIARAALRRRGEVSAHEAGRWVNGIAFDGPINRGLARAETAAPGTAALLTAWLAEMAAAATGQRP